MQYGTVLAGLRPDHPSLRMIDATAAVFRAQAIPTVLFVVPTNVEHLERLGVLDRTGLGVSIAAVAEIAERRGAYFVDLHDAFADDVFTDATGHFGVRRGSDGAARLAALLEPHVRRVLGSD